MYLLTLSIGLLLLVAGATAGSLQFVLLGAFVALLNFARGESLYERPITREPKPSAASIEYERAALHYFFRGLLSRMSWIFLLVPAGILVGWCVSRRRAVDLAEPLLLCTVVYWMMTGIVCVVVPLLLEGWITIRHSLIGVRGRSYRLDQLIDQGEEAIPILMRAFTTYEGSSWGTIALTASPHDSVSSVSDHVRMHPYAVQLQPEGTRTHPPVGGGTRHLAAEGLGCLKVTAAVEPLRKVLSEPDHLLRAKAIWALGEVGDPSALPDLIPLLGDETVSGVAGRSLTTMGRRDLVLAFHQALRRDSEAIGWLHAQPYLEQAVSAYVRLLRSSIPDRVMGAAWVIGELKAVTALRPLRAACRTRLGSRGQVLRELRLAIEKIETLAGLPSPSAPSTGTDARSLPRPAVQVAGVTSTLPRQIGCSAE